MKYYLAIDKGEKTNYTKRYRILNLSILDTRFNQNNNLEILTRYTMTFTSSPEFKNFLHAKQILQSKYLAYDLVIIYKVKYHHQEYTRKLIVPYISLQNYFSPENLIDIIFTSSYNPEFLPAFLHELKKMYHLPESYYQLLSDLTNYRLQENLYSRISSLVYDICYPKSRGVESFRYRKLYDLAMLTAKLTTSKYSLGYIPNVSLKPKILSEVELFELESLLDRVENHSLKRTLTTKVHEQYRLHHQEIDRIFLT